MVPRDDDDEDLDRAAILARRQRFIALALTSMVLSCGDDGSPQPCLDVAVGSSSGGTSDGVTSTSAGLTSTAGSTGAPMPCLDVAPATDSGTSGADETATSGTDGTDGTSGTGTSTGG